VARARVVFGGVVVGILLIGAWALLRATSTSDAQRSPLEVRVAALEAGPRRTERVIEREVRTEVVAPAPLPTGGAGPDDAEPGSEAGAPRRTSAELGAVYAASFAAEPVDAGWAADAERRYLPAIRQVLPASSRLVSFECRSWFCDVAVAHDSIDASNGFILGLFAIERQGPLSQGVAGFRTGEPQRTDDGKLLYHLYIGRPGAQLAIDPPQDPPAPHADKHS
jgi:hypothetical protein